MERTKIGPYETGRVYQGDCLELMKRLPLGRFGGIVTDPPYGQGYSSGHGSESWGDGSIQNDDDTMARDAMIALSQDLPMLVFGSWKVPHPTGTRMLLVWDTLGALGMGDLRLPWKPAHQEIYVLGDAEGFAGKRGTDVLRYAPVQSMAKNGRLHPMQKPVALMKRLVESIPRGAILDPFAGSGTTGVACVELGREFLGFEIDPNYCKLANDRIEAVRKGITLKEHRAGQKTLFEDVQ